ncbi:MAG: hypothetical protein K0U66_06000 [Gammaproteobacteria bacterium]|nr:hypothetical protein [Gammaproteobacteria bacterium]
MQAGTGATSVVGYCVSWMLVSGMDGHRVLAEAVSDMGGCQVLAEVGMVATVVCLDG